MRPADMLVREVPVAQTRALRQAVLRPHQTIGELAAEEPEIVFAAGAFQAGELIAVGLVMPEGEPGAWRVRGMATAAQSRGRGAGAAILDALVRHARSNGATRIWCSARIAAVPFYERSGLAVSSEPYAVPHIGEHVAMEMRLGAKRPPRHGAGVTPLEAACGGAAHPRSQAEAASDGARSERAWRPAGS